MVPCILLDPDSLPVILASVAQGQETVGGFLVLSALKGVHMREGFVVLILAPVWA